MDTLLHSIIKNDEDSSKKLIEDLFLKQISSLSIAASLNQKNVVICLLKYTKVNCTTFLMRELITKGLFEMASLFIINKRITPLALKNFNTESNEQKYLNLDKFLNYLEDKNIKINNDDLPYHNDDICHSGFFPRELKFDSSDKIEVGEKLVFLRPVKDFDPTKKSTSHTMTHHTLDTSCGPETLV